MGFKLLYLSCLSLLLTLAKPASAQLSPDNTLGNEPSIVNPNNIITGGATRGTNLFHSFREFNVNAGQSVFFANPLGITDIFTRVTGSNASNIFGTLGVSGNANLYLINPNGIIFGQGASLNLNGSFTATTAENLLFPTNLVGTTVEFSAVNPQPVANNVIINFPISFGFGDPNLGLNTSEILVAGPGQNLQPQVEGQLIARRDTSQSLAVNPGQSISLIGGNINFDGGLVAAEGGTVTVAGVQQGTVSLDREGEFNFETVSSFGTVQLANGSLIDVSSPPNSTLGSGSVEIFGSTVELLDNSVILNQNQNIGSGGSVEVTANENFSAIGTNDGRLRSGIYSETGGLNSGEGASISVRSPTILLENAAITANTYSAAEGGSISITTNNLEIAPDASISTLTTGIGAGGEISLEPLSGNTIAISDPNLITATSQGIGEPGEISIDGVVIQGRIFTTPEVVLEAIEQLEVEQIVPIQEDEDLIVSLLTRQSYPEYIDTLNRSCQPASETEDTSKFGIKDVFPTQKFLEEGGSWQFDIFITTDDRSKKQENWHEVILPNAIITGTDGKTYLGLVCATKIQ